MTRTNSHSKIRTERIQRRYHRPARHRRGQSLVEFALISLVLYMLIAAVLTFGHMLFVAQTTQGAVDLAAREISRVPLPHDMTLEQALGETVVIDNVYSEDFLVYELQDDENFFQDVVPNWPVVNQQLAQLMITDRFDTDGDDDRILLRYPGALLSNANTPTGFTVAIPLVIDQQGDGTEVIQWIPVVEEIDSDDNPDPFLLSSTQRGIVALRINYPFQSASMSGFAFDEDAPFEENIGNPIVAVGVSAPDAPPNGTVIQRLLQNGNEYAGTYGGTYGLGAQGALGSQQLTGGRPVRPFRRVISTQAIYRREIFSN